MLKQKGVMGLTFEDEYDPVDIEDYLAHYGRKGMKWYEHIFGKLQSHAKYNKGGKKTETTKTIKEPRKSNKYKKLSTEELKKRIERLEVEKRYVDLNRETRTTGKKIVDSVLGSIGKAGLQVLQDQTKNLGNQVVGDFIKKMKKK